jgi:hypothetical protein
MAILELPIGEDIAGLEGKHAGSVDGLYCDSGIPPLRNRRELLPASLNWARKTNALRSRSIAIDVRRRFK